MEEDKEDDPNTIISFPRRDGDRAGHGAGMGRAGVGWAGMKGLPGGGAEA